MGKHWRPDDKIIQGPWTRPSDHREFDPEKTPRVIPVVLGAVLVAFIAAGLLSWTAKSVRSDKPDSPIEWNAVQAVPTRAPDAQDAAWERRAKALDVTSSPSAEAPAMKASFGYCYAGGGTNCVVDGDTFYIGGEKVRIAGIDAPETHPPRCADEARLGNQATQKLHALLNSGAVTMTSIDRDRDVYGRLLRNVVVGDQDVGEAMISAGVAREYGSGRRAWCG